MGAKVDHLGVLVDDIDARLATLRDAGVPLADDEPRPGAGGSRVAFLEREAANGVRVELVERDGDVSLG
jgi:catechol 2,3-dioxygenase-like lactoylglutathione lyase family enzyme